MQRIRLGNTEIDGEAFGHDGNRIAIEIKTANDEPRKLSHRSSNIMDGNYMG